MVGTLKARELRIAAGRLLRFYVDDGGGGLGRDAFTVMRAQLPPAGQGSRSSTERVNVSAQTPRPSL